MAHRDKELKTWWGTLSPEERKQAKKDDKSAARSLLSSDVPLTSDERQALERDGTLPLDVRTYIMRHD